MEIAAEKARLRQKIWKEMEEKGVARFPFPIVGRIPNFEGAEVAAEKVRKLNAWKKAKIIFANPDSAQRKARELALIDRKILIMASPRLKAGFLLLDPKEKRIVGNEEFASTIKGAFALGKKITEDEVRKYKIDVKITGSVALNVDGTRLGKSGGYGDREIALCREINRNVVVISTIHDLQLIEEKIPMEPWDQKVDIIVTPTKIVYCKKR